MYLLIYVQNIKKGLPQDIHISAKKYISNNQSIQYLLNYYIRLYIFILYSTLNISYILLRYFLTFLYRESRNFSTKTITFYF